ncbi:hypothetical protein RFI_18646 [Reticulomyxa filosa]|uniref:Uncharacterized protein n=1 Tax=Reticulomyxa filosa TaxID=46433 RepID=X6MX63_RETFI|nr:hypothetical protein RFI_18646 [Reticulomyxa filosa]|eukprot:ETO18615.1 hypothetical protein RFI_18646 [Reticulomyxa filosa]
MDHIHVEKFFSMFSFFFFFFADSIIVQCKHKKFKSFVKSFTEIITKERHAVFNANSKAIEKCLWIHKMAPITLRKRVANIIAVCLFKMSNCIFNERKNKESIFLNSYFFFFKQQNETS